MKNNLAIYLMYNVAQSADFPLNFYFLHLSTELRISTGNYLLWFIYKFTFN